MNWLSSIGYCCWDGMDSLGLCIISAPFESLSTGVNDLVVPYQSGKFFMFILSFSSHRQFIMRGLFVHDLLPLLLRFRITTVDRWFVFVIAQADIVLHPACLVLPLVQ